MILIKVCGPYSYVDCSERDERKLYNGLAADVPYAMRNPRTRDLVISKMWDGKVHFFNRASHRVPTGMVPLIQDSFAEVHVRGQESPDPKWIRLGLKRLKKIELNGIEALGDFQKLCVKRMIQSQSGICKIATNGGKTEIASAFIKAVEGLKVLYMIHLKTLLHQTADRIKLRTGIKVGKIGDGLRKVLPVTVAMVQSLPKPIKANQKFYDQWDVLILDEAQHTSAKTWFDIAMKMRAPWRFALSGTPWTGDDTKDGRLISAVGPKILANVKNKELIERGWSATPTVHVWEQPGRPNNLSWRLAYDTMIVNDLEYNERVVQIARESWEQGKTTLVIVNYKRHANRLYRRMLGEKIDCKYVTGDFKSPYVKKLLKRFQEGKLGVIICTPMFDEGVDVPAIRTLILAAAGKAPIRLLQRIGRALRKKKSGANVAEIHDFITYGNDHLERHSLKRMEIYLEEDFDIRFHKAKPIGSKRYLETETIDWDAFHKEGQR